MSTFDLTQFVFLRKTHFASTKNTIFHPLRSLFTRANSISSLLSTQNECEIPYFGSSSVLKNPTWSSFSEIVEPLGRARYSPELSLSAKLSRVLKNEAEVQGQSTKKPPS